MLRISKQNSQAAVTSFGTFKLDSDKAFLSGEYDFTPEFRQIPGLVAGAVYLSLDHQQIAEYLQWKDLAAFEAGIRSAEYRRHLSAMIGETNEVAAEPYDVVYVNDARPGVDRFDAAVVKEKDKFITMLIVFDAQPGKRGELFDLMRRDHESFLYAGDGFIAVTFHRALRNENTAFEILQFESPEKLETVSKTPGGAAHIAAIAQIAAADQNIYRVRSVFAKENEDASDK